MNNDELFKSLAQHYNLDPRNDWYQLHGKWILTHDAVRKLSKQKTKDGHSVIVPIKFNVLKDGTVSEGGVNGPEVVFSGEFRLVDESGKTVHQVLSIGEANEKNCKLPYSWAMAYKRCFDRGVLDLLSFAELGVYSATEADSFAAAAPANDPAAVAPLPTAGAVDPPTPPPAIPTPAGGGVPSPRPPQPTSPAPSSDVQPPSPSRRRMTHEESEDLIICAISSGVNRPKQIREETGMTQSQYQRAIASLLESNRVDRVGQKAGTKYYLPGQAPEDSPAVESPESVAPPSEVVAPVRLAPTPPVPEAPQPVVADDPAVDKGEFDQAFDKALGFGVTFLDAIRIMTELSGVSDIRVAQEQGKITKSVISEFLRRTEEEAAA